MKHQTMLDGVVALLEAMGDRDHLFSVEQFFPGEKTVPALLQQVRMTLTRRQRQELVKICAHDDGYCIRFFTAYGAGSDGTLFLAVLYWKRERRHLCYSNLPAKCPTFEVAALLS